MKYPEHYQETTPIVGELAKEVRKSFEKNIAYTNANALALFDKIMKKEKNKKDGEKAKV